MRDGDCFYNAPVSLDPFALLRGRILLTQGRFDWFGGLALSPNVSKKLRCVMGEI